MPSGDIAQVFDRALDALRLEASSSVRAEASTEDTRGLERMPFKSGP